MASSVRLAEETTAQIVVVTVENLEDRPLEEYATDLFRKFGIGDKEKNNGVLILLSVGDRKSRIELGYGMEGYISDAKSGRIQDQYMIPYYKKNDFDSGMLNGYKALYNEVSNAYAIKSNIQPQKAEKNNLSTIIFLFIILKIIADVFALFVQKKSDKQKLAWFTGLEAITASLAGAEFINSGTSTWIWMFLIGTIINYFLGLKNRDFSNVTFTSYGGSNYSSGSSGGHSRGHSGGYSGGHSS